VAIRTATPTRNEAEGGRGLLGLSVGHIPGKPFYLRFIKHGGLVTVGRGDVGYCGPRPDSSKRGQISEFSRKSQMTFRKLLASIIIGFLPLFVTLTYPAAWDYDWKRWKRDLERLFERIAYRWPAASLVWKLEFQKRGAPHFHCFLFGLYSKRERHDFKEFISEAWFEIVGSEDEKHKRAGTRCEDIRSRAGVMSYSVGYASKKNQTLVGEHVGRYWGVMGRAHLPVGEKVELEIPKAAYKSIKRCFTRFQKAMKRKSQVLRIAKKEKVSFGDVMNGLARQEYKSSKVYKPRVGNNATVNLFANQEQDDWKWLKFMAFEIEKAERQLNRHVEEPF
jgi:hypothetical protein